MVFSPPRFYSRNLSTPWSLSLPMHSSSIEILCDCFQYLQDRWQELRDRLNELLEEGDTLFNPSAHDRLLWDDENFTRSRKYFWAIHVSGQGASNLVRKNMQREMVVSEPTPTTFLTLQMNK
jgi:hypothetical protein